MKTSITILLCLFLLVGLMNMIAYGQVNMAVSGSYSQDFNTLVTTGSGTWTDNSTIASWYAQRTGTGTTIVAGDGASNAGALYSFGTGTASDRALGSLGSGGASAGHFAWGLLLRNTSGTSISDIQVSYVGEQWRNSADAVAQAATFWYKTSSSIIDSLNPNINTGWTSVAALDFAAPITGGTAAALDGNSAPNRTTFSNVSIPGLSLAHNDYIMLRWSDVNHTGNDHGLAIDSVTIVWTTGGATADGDGSASLVNDGGGTFDGTTIFSRNSGSQTVLVTITGTGAGDLDKVRLTVPSTWSGYNAANVSFGGAFTGKSNVGTGNNIQIDGAALGLTPGTITITGLTSANPNTAGANGQDTWTVQTAVSGGTLTNIFSSPVSYTIIPISNLRTGGTDGFGNSDAGGETPVLLNNTVVVQGIITVPNGVLASTSTTSIIIQDGSYGVQIFKSATNTSATLTLGKEIVVRGNVEAFNGNTEVVPASVSSPDLFEIGTPGAPSPTVIANASLISEANEGKLVQINAVTWDSTGQAFASSADNQADNNFNGGAGTLYLNFVNDAVGLPIPASSNIVGVVYHRTDLTGDQQLHKIAPRNKVDLGFSAGDGTGTATISPSTRFPSVSSLAETLWVKGDGANTLAAVSVAIPSSWTWDGASRAISGAGFSGASTSVSGDGSSGTPWVITINSTAVTGTDSGRIIISNLTTPSSVGNTTFTVKTKGTGGGATLANISSQPTVNIAGGFEAIATGNWSSTSTWSGGVVPSAGSNVTMTTLGVTVTVDIPNAECNNLTITGSGTASNSGPLLEFAAAGSPQLTVNGSLSITGGSGGGGGDRGGRPKLSSNANSNATLIVKGNIITTSSNSVSNGSAGLTMNEGTVKLTGSSTDSIKNGASFRMSNLQIGDGTNAKTVVWAPTTNSTMNVRSLTVKNNAIFWAGNGTGTQTGTIGNATSDTLPHLTGGITIEAGGSMLVQESTGGFVENSIFIEDGGMTINGTLSLRSAGLASKTMMRNPSAATGCVYDVNFGTNGGGTSSSQSISGTQVGEFAGIIAGASDTVTLTLAQDVNIGPFYAMTIGRNGTLSETAGNTVHGTVEATRVMTSSSDESFGGIGLTLNASGAAPDTTTVTRVTNTAQTGGGHQSILRYFDISPKVNAGLNATVSFFYDNSELNGQDANTLSLWSSTNSGSSWDAVGGTANAGLNRVQATGVNSFARLTAADASNGLGGGTFSYTYSAKWNMVSLPLTVGDARKVTLFPLATSNAFYYDNGYAVEDTLKPGIGYWVKLPAADTIDIFGSPVSNVSVNVQTGWNMVGSVSDPIDVSNIQTTPGGLVTSPFYGYDNGYTVTDTLWPGKAYWVKTTGAGTMELSVGAVAEASNRIRIVPGNERPPAPPSGEQLAGGADRLMPKEFALGGNYPNPFNPSTRFEIAVPKAAHVEVAVFNILGQKVATLISQELAAGYHAIEWHGTTDASSPAGSGMYFLRMQSGDFSAVKKIMLMK